MKYIILILLLGICDNSFSQKKEIVSKYVDSVYYITYSDTLYGNISYKFGNGVVKGEGMVVKSESYTYNSRVLKPQFRYLKDSLNFSIGGIGVGGYPNRTGYIKTEKGYKRVNEEFTFTPK